MIMEVLVEHDRLKNWEKLKEGEVIVDENKENQPIIGRVMTKRTYITDIICYESTSKNEKQTEKRNSNKKSADRKKEIRVVIEEPSLVLIDRIVEGQEKRRKLKAALVENWEENIFSSTEQGIRGTFWGQQNKRADRIAKEEGKVDVPTRVKRVMTEATRAEWTFNQGLYDEIHQKQVWIKKEEEILKSIKEELKQKDKIALGLNKLREVFMPRDIKEYKEQHI
ncbi:40023_t:CDS:2, partial [Gigaspora margarita]